MKKIAVKTINREEQILAAEWLLLLTLFVLAIFYLVTAIPAAAQDAAEAPADPALQGSTWQWEYFADGVKAMEILDANYTISFSEDGSFHAKADCNIVLGTYTTEDGTITLQPGPTTLAACPAGSLEGDFIDYLKRAVIYSFTEDGKLLIELPADSGSLRFSAQPQISGTVTYLERIALPEKTAIRVQLIDVSIADVEAPVVGETILNSDGAQVPFAFTISYTQAAIQEKHTYALSARISDSDGKLLFVSDTHIPADLSQTPAEGFEIILKKAN